MQATPPRVHLSDHGRIGRQLSYFLALPVATFVLLSLALAGFSTIYQGRHDGRVFTGVSVWDVDLSGLDEAQAREALDQVFPYAQEKSITFVDPVERSRWQRTPAEMGLMLDVDATIDAAFQIGREGNPLQRYGDMVNSWYYGRSLAPILILDEGRLDQSLSELAAEIDRTPTDARIAVGEDGVSYRPSQAGRALDTGDLRQRLLAPMIQFRPAEVELLIRPVRPAIFDDPTVAERIRHTLGGPISFFLAEPLADLDLGRLELPEETLLSWIRVDVVAGEGGGLRHEVFVDENAVRHWLAQYAEEIYREPVNARFYFDDNTRELVLVAPHVNGRSLDIEATLARFQEQVTSANRMVPLIVNEIVPTVHSGATGEELGIVELVTERTTWFRGSSDARKHNIARAAANFYGIVIAPGEEFSFNKYLGSISEADGYEEGLIIVGGQTIKGIGGGVCQVSTTMYQTAFWGGFPISERWEHGYMLGYYNDGEGPGMDATVFSPIVDFRFINNTEHHLLIENYYNEANEALTVKMYSTDLGRLVEKSEPLFEDIVPAPTTADDIWTYDEDLPPGTVQQIDWATEGARVTVTRTVYNADGQVILDEDFVSNYIPWANGYNYGPDVEPYDYSLVPPSP